VDLWEQAALIVDAGAAEDHVLNKQLTEPMDLGILQTTEPRWTV
jgi:hypothetical protein